MKETLLIKHAVGGRTFIDTAKTPLDYEVVQDEDGRWRFAVQRPPLEAVREILAWKSELNVFLFREEPGKPVTKIWFYVTAGPVAYDEAAKRLTLEAEDSITYIPDEFGYTS